MSVFERAMKPARQSENASAKPDPTLGARNALPYSILELQRKIGNQAVQRILARTSTPLIQRKATWDAGKVHEINNLASVIVKNKVEADGRGALGFTYPVLNGTLLPPGNFIDAQKAILSPEIVAGQDANGQSYAQVKSAPTNTGSFDENVLAPPPWKTTVQKSAVHEILPSLSDCSGKGDTVFQALGDPTDKDMFEANRRHEDHHAKDYQDVFESTIVAWDAKLTAAQSSGTKFPGKSQDEAVDNLYKTMGGMSHPIAIAYKKGAYDSGAKFHQTPKGAGPSSAKNIKSENDCATSSAAYFNPG
jgi:hypothetical protein